MFTLTTIALRYVALHLLDLPTAEYLPITLKARMFLFLVRRHLNLLENSRYFDILIDEYQSTLDLSLCPSVIDNTVLSMVQRCKYLTTLKLSKNKITAIFLYK